MDEEVEAIGDVAKAIFPTALIQIAMDALLRNLDAKRRANSTQTAATEKSTQRKNLFSATTAKRFRVRSGERGPESFGQTGPRGPRPEPKPETPSGFHPRAKSDRGRRRVFA
jgi:hypothetical protein